MNLAKVENSMDDMRWLGWEDKGSEQWNVGHKGQRERRNSWEQKVVVSGLSKSEQEPQHTVDLWWAPLAGDALWSPCHPVPSAPLWTSGYKKLQRLNNLGLCSGEFGHFHCTWLPLDGRKMQKRSRWLVRGTRRAVVCGWDSGHELFTFSLL